ncbi:MAG TPA: hypothetical protein VK610_09305 [Rhodothermales bacterium]|nr:hypothetical protein [Rhodothermales bacterium]
MEAWTEDDVDRVLEWYEKEPGDALVGEEPLAGIGLDELRTLFHPDDEDDPEMVLSYEVETPAEAAALQRAVTHPIDLDAHDYFVAAYRKGS